MATATPTRTLADVYRDRLAATDYSDRLATAIGDAVGEMAPYSHETGDLRPSEIAWLDQLAGDAVEAAKAAAIAAIADVYARALPRLLPSSGDPAAPAHLWEQGGDVLQADVELAAE
jgi:hypothetical protein